MKSLLILAIVTTSTLTHAFAREYVINNVETSAGGCNKLLLKHARAFNASRRVGRHGGWVFVSKKPPKEVIGQASFQPSSRRCNLLIY